MTVSERCVPKMFGVVHSLDCQKERLDALLAAANERAEAAETEVKELTDDFDILFKARERDSASLKEAVGLLAEEVGQNPENHHAIWPCECTKHAFLLRQKKEVP